MSSLNPFKITHAEASANILRFVAECRLVQKTWHTKDAEGRELACALGAMHPSVTKPQDCNGDLMPLWLAELTPTLFDGIPATEVSNIGTRYGTLVGQWHVLSPESWNTILTKFLIRTIDDAVEAARPVASTAIYWTQVETACEGVKKALNGDGDLNAAEAAAYAANAAAYAAYAAARAAAYAAYAAYAAARAAANAANAAYAARAAAYAAYAAAYAAYAASYAAAYAAAYLKLFTFLLDIIEQQIKGIQ